MYLSTKNMQLSSHTTTIYLCVIRAPNHTQAFVKPLPTLTTRLIEITYCHDRYPNQALTHNHTKYGPLINTIQKQWMEDQPLITITTRVRRAIHEHSIKKLTNLERPRLTIKTLMKNIHQNAIKYLTYLVKGGKL